MQCAQFNSVESRGEYFTTVPRAAAQYGRKGAAASVARVPKRVAFSVTQQPRAMDNPQSALRTPLAGVSTLEDAARLIRASHRILVVAGAGVSVAAGVPDFRSPHTGFYDVLQRSGNSALASVGEAQEVFDLRVFNAEPEIFFGVAHLLYDRLGERDAAPSLHNVSPTHNHPTPPSQSRPRRRWRTASSPPSMLAAASCASTRRTSTGSTGARACRLRALLRHTGPLQRRRASGAGTASRPRSCARQLLHGTSPVAPCPRLAVVVAAAAAAAADTAWVAAAAAC